MRTCKRCAELRSRPDPLLHALGAVLLLLAAACAPAEEDVSVAIRGATVVDVASGGLTQDQTVLVAGDRIVAVGPAEDTPIPQGATVVDGQGRFVIPGLWDMHVHVFMGSDAPAMARTRADASSWDFWRETRGPMLDVFLAHGVTGIREMWGNLSVIERYRAERSDSGFVGPRLVAPGHIVAGDPNDRGYLVARTPEDARQIVDSVAGAGADFIKVYPGMSSETFSALAARAAEAGLHVAGHVDWNLWLEEQVAAGQREFSHVGMLGCAETQEDWTDLEEVAGDYCDRAEAALTSQKVWVTPTLTVFGAAYAGSTEELVERWKYVPWFYRAVWTPPAETDPQQAEMERERLERFLSMVDYFHDRGVPMMAGTDTPFPPVVPGYGLHQELSLLVRAGFTPLEALQAATLEPARYLEATDSLGAVAEGNVADLVVLDANPLDDIANTRRIHAVVAGGVLLDRPRLNEMLEAAAQRFEAPESAPDP